MTKDEFEKDNKGVLKMTKDEFFVSLKEIEIKFGIAINELLNSEEKLNDELFKTSNDIKLLQKTLPVSLITGKLLFLYVELKRLNSINII